MPRPKEEDRNFVRSEVVKLRLRPPQLIRWTAKAKEQGVSLAEWIRATMDRDARM